MRSALPVFPCAENADAVQPAGGRERADDPGARRAVAADVAELVGDDRDLLSVEARRRPRSRFRRRAGGRRRRRCRGCRRRRPRRSHPPSAHSFVTRSGHSAAIAIEAAASAVRLQAGMSRSLMTAPSRHVARAAAAAAAASSAARAECAVAAHRREVDLDEMRCGPRGAPPRGRRRRSHRGGGAASPRPPCSAASSATSAAASAIRSGTSAARRAPCPSAKSRCSGDPVGSPHRREHVRRTPSASSSREHRAGARAGRAPAMATPAAVRPSRSSRARPSSRATPPSRPATAAADPPHGDGAGASSSSRNPSRPGRLGRRRPWASVTRRGVCAGARPRRAAARPRRCAGHPRDRRREPAGTRHPASARATSASSSARANGQLLRCLDPAGRSGREQPQQLAEALFVVRRHSITMSTGRGSGGVSSVIDPTPAPCGGGRGSARSGSRSCRPGSSSASPIVR